MIRKSRRIGKERQEDYLKKNVKRGERGSKTEERGRIKGEKRIDWGGGNCLSCNSRKGKR